MTWVWREGLGVVLKSEAPPLPRHGVRHGNAPMVCGDIAAYQSTITGEIISSRSQHRTHLKDHSCFEVGNEKLSGQQRNPAEMPSVAEDIKRAMEQPLPASVTQGPNPDLGPIERIYNG